MEKILSEFPPVATEAWEKAIAEDFHPTDKSPSVGTPDFHPTDNSPSVGTPDFHPTDNSPSVGTPDFHPTDNSPSVGTPDLKGAKYAEKLIWRSPEGIAVKPYYRAEDAAGLEWLNAAPGEFPYARGAHSAGGWRIREQIDGVDPEEANSAARCAVAGGAEEIAFSQVVVSNSSDLGILVANLGEIPVHFSHASQAMIRLVLERMIRRQSGTMRSAALDWSADPAFSAEVMAQAPAALVPFTIRAQDYANSGATAVDEVALALASGVDFLAEMEERGVPVDRAAESVAFSFAMGPEFFMQIAKLRAFRMLWAQAVTSFGGAREHARARIYALTSRWNRTVYDPQVNMLRATTEAMSAVLGGADSIYVIPFDECYNVGDETSRRLARNTQIIFKQEAYLGRVADAGGGSYYLEALTSLIAQRAWTQLQEIEAAGGFRKAAALIEQTLEQRKAAQAKSVITRRRVLTGTNRFADAEEQALERIGGELVHDSGRAALPFEEMRLRTERSDVRTGKTPRVLLAEIGDAKMRAARSGFVTDFMACAGLAAEIRRFETAREIAAAEADLVVLCSSDPEYFPVATELLAELKSRGVQTPLVVAGNPDTAEQLRAAGITEFIHVRSNPIEVLTKLQQLLGIGK